MSTRPLLRLLTAVLLALGGLLCAGGPAPAADNGTWAVFPVPAGASTTTVVPDRQYFYLEAAAGATLSDKVSVVNLSAKPISFQLYGADAYNTPRDGGFALRAADQPQVGVGAWVKLDSTAVTVPPHSRRDIPFHLTVPATAQPGDHPGAIVALETAIESSTTSGNVAVGIRRAVGARIYLRVSGPAVPALTLTGLRIDRSSPLIPGLGSASAVVHYTVQNRGNVTLRPALTLKATGWLGGTVLDLRGKDLGIELLPGQQVDLSYVWAHPPQFDHVSLTLGVGASATTADAQSGFLAVAWLPVGLVVALLLALVLLLRQRARRRRAARGGGGPRGRRRVPEGAAA